MGDGAGDENRVGVGMDVAIWRKSANVAEGCESTVYYAWLRSGGVQLRALLETLHVFLQKKEE